MLLFYIDEFGDSGVKEKALQWPGYFMLGAMQIHDTQRMSLYHKIRKIKDYYAPHWRKLDWDKAEIKGRYLAERFWPRGDAALPENRIDNFINALFNTIHAFRPVFYFVAIEKTSMTKRFAPATQSPVGLAYAHLQTRAALLINNVYGGDECAVFLADEQTEHEGLYTRGGIKETQEAAQAFVKQPVDIGYVLEKPIWLNKNQMPVDREILQLVDFALYCIRGAIVEDQPDEQNLWLSHLRPHIARNWSTGKFWNGGITIVPKPTRYPNI